MPPATVHVSYGAMIWLACNCCPGEDIELEQPATLASLLAKVIARHGPDLASRIYQKNGDLHPGIWIIINGRLVPKEAATPLSPGDNVFLTSPLPGGG